MKLNRKGFTLVELLAVIVVLAIIALIGYTAIGPLIQDARTGAKARSMDNFESELTKQCLLTMAKEGKAPTEASDVTKLITAAAANTKGEYPTLTNSQVTVDANCDITISEVSGWDGVDCEKDASKGWTCKKAGS